MPGIRLVEVILNLLLAGPFLVYFVLYYAYSFCVDVAHLGLIEFGSGLDSLIFLGATYITFGEILVVVFIIVTGFATIYYMTAPKKRSRKKAAPPDQGGTDVG